MNEGLREVLDEVSPIEDFTETFQLVFGAHHFKEVKYSVEECKDKDMTYSRPLFVEAAFINKETGEIKEQEVFMGDFPMMSEKGTFVINGTERVVVSQLVRSPGVYFSRELDKTSNWTRPPTATSTSPRSSLRGGPGSSSTWTSGTRSACGSTGSAART